MEESRYNNTNSPKPVLPEGFEFLPVKRSIVIKKEKNDNGEKTELPIDADANGAYNIARKGLMLINQIKETSDEDILNNKVKFNITNKEWLKFAQGDK